MAERKEIAAVFTAAVVQGIVLVTFPAVSAVLTGPGAYGLTTGEYGTMFVPQAVTAVLASLLGGALTRRVGSKRVLLAGLGADVGSMALLFASQFATGDKGATYGLLLAATGLLGVGFGCVVPALNTFTAAFFPRGTDRAILGLNALLGLGTALAPVFAALFVGYGVWWGLPVLMSVLAAGLLGFAGTLALDETEGGSGGDGAGGERRKTGAESGGGGRKQEGGGVPGRFWVYAAFALVYGVCETVNANWAGVYLREGLGAGATAAALALTVFWAAVTGGRLLSAAVARWVPQTWMFRLLPLGLGAALVGIAAVPRGQGTLALVGFGAAGLGCSALLPLVISFGQAELRRMGAAVAGALIGCYQLGYGLAAFGVGPLERWAHLGLGQVYGWAGAGAVGLAGLASVIVAGRQEGRTNSAAS